MDYIVFAGYVVLLVILYQSIYVIGSDKSNIKLLYGLNLILFILNFISYIPGISNNKYIGLSLNILNILLTAYLLIKVYKGNKIKEINQKLSIISFLVVVCGYTYIFCTRII